MWKMVTIALNLNGVMMSSIKPLYNLMRHQNKSDDIMILWFVLLGVWNKVLEPIENYRRENDLVKIFPQFLNGEDLYGLTEPNVLRVIESVSQSFFPYNRNNSLFFSDGIEK